VSAPKLRTALAATLLALAAASAADFGFGGGPMCYPGGGWML
jgi:hypothetical protein